MKDFIDKYLGEIALFTLALDLLLALTLLILGVFWLVSYLLGS